MLLLLFVHIDGHEYEIVDKLCLFRGHAAAELYSRMYSTGSGEGVRQSLHCKIVRNGKCGCPSGTIWLLNYLKDE